MRASSAPPTPLAVEPCTRESNQALTCYEACSGPRHLLPSHGMQQFLHSPGNCMAGNATDHKMYAAPCNLTDQNQRFMQAAVAGGFLWTMNPERGDKVTHCLTAKNCTIVNSTDVECPGGAPIELAPCQPNWPGSPLPNVPNPLQVWTAGATAGGPNGPYGDTGALKLAFTWHRADHPKGKPAKKNTTSCLTASGFPPVPPPPPTPPLPPAPPAAAGDLAMATCTNEADQDLTCFGKCGGPRSPSYGMLEFKNHAGSCLNGGLDDKLMHTMPCNLSVREQRFAQLGANAPMVGGYMLAMNPEHENKVTYCVTANCTVVNATLVACEAGARVALAPCVFSWAGTPLPNVPDPRQVRVASRSIPPRWGPIRFRPLICAYAPRGCIVVRTCG